MLLRSAALVVSAVLATTLTGTSPAQASIRVVLDKGHVDVVDVEFDAGEFELHVHDETVDPAAERDPDDVLLRVPPGALTTVPDDPAFAFLGAPGAPVWELPQVENPDLLFAGLSTEELAPGDFAGDQVTLRLLHAFGPGDFSLFTQGAFGEPQVLLNSGDGLPDAVSLPIATHLHANWAFTEKGFYALVFKVSGTLSGTGQSISSDTATIVFKVG